MQAKELISKKIPVLDLHDSGMFALNLMQESKLHHLPIVHNGKYIGITSDEVLLRLSNLETVVSEAIVCSPMIRAHQMWVDILPLLTQFKLSIIPVVSDTLYIGSILIEAITERLTELFICSSDGSMLTIEVNASDYVPSEIARLVEANNAKILTLFTQPIEQTNKLLVYLTVNLEDASAIIRSFERFNYKIAHYIMPESAIDDTLKERLDEFLHYLKI